MKKIVTLLLAVAMLLTLVACGNGSKDTTANGEETTASQAVESKDPLTVLQTVWEARRNLAPAFGTMVGTSELLLISIQMDETWTAFLRERLSDKDVSQAMEEFLFGLSYEQIQTLRRILRERGIAAIGRDEISTFLEQEIKIDVASDLRDFYMQYTVRRDNARTRKRLQIQGPHNTLEDHYMRFVLERNKEKQENDSE